MLKHQIVPQEFDNVSDAERSRRWARIRVEMSTRGVDCLLLNGTSGRWNEMNANIRYVSGYADPLSGACYALFPLQGDGTLVTQMQPKRSAYSMSWFKDIRGMATVDLPAIVVERLTALGLQRGTLGLVGVTFWDRENIGIPYNLYQAIQKDLPNVRLVDITDLFFELRSVKSDEEINCLAESAKLVDAGYEAHIKLARVGMTEREYYAGIVHAMDAAGAEPPTFLLLSSGPMPREMLTQDPIPSKRLLAKGDVVASETSPKFAGYQAQGLQCIVFGKPTAEMQELAKYAAEIWHKCADKIRPGNTQETVIHAADDVIERARQKMGALADGLRPICGAAGLGGPDPSIRPKEFQPNQAFMLEMGPGGRAYAPVQHINGGYLITTTRGAPRHHFGKYPIEKRLLTVIQ